jgi:tagaturonate reductase
VTPILQFGTSRFLQAHVDLFVSEALARGEAIGAITVVQTTTSPESRRRIDAFNRTPSFPVLVRGLENGTLVDRRVEVTSVARAFDAGADWEAIEKIFVREARAIVSNTGDRGFGIDPSDRPDDRIPRSFPDKLAKLLLARYRESGVPLDLFSCELITGNGAALRQAVLTVAHGWQLESDFLDWLERKCRWVNSLVDRIVSEALDPVGAVAEPYALWAIETQPQLAPICRHAAVVLTDDLVRYERLKLFILNLGHSFLAERWMLDARPRGETVREALADPKFVASLDRLYEQEVLPVLAALGLAAEAEDYKRVVMERFRNPFLDHKIADIAVNHDAKKARRFGPHRVGEGARPGYRPIPSDRRACLADRRGCFLNIIPDESWPRLEPPP